MRKVRIVFVNNASNTLHVRYHWCGRNNTRNIQVRSRKILKLIPGRYEVHLGYTEGNLEVTSKIGQIRDVDDLPSHKNEKCRGKKIMITDQHGSVKLKCTQTVSIAGHIEKLS